MSTKKEYIDFYYDNNNNFTAEIHINGKVKKITNKKNLLLLLNICKEYGFIVNREGYIDTDVKSIAYEYEKRKNRKKNKLEIFNPVNSNMKINRKKSKRKSKGLLIMPLALVGILAFNSFIKNNSNGDNKDKSSEGQNPKNEISMNTDDDIEYYTSEEDLQQDIQNRITQMLKEQGKTINNEITKMVEEQKIFHFSYEDRSNSENLENARRYQDIFEKYGHMYGVDPNLLMAIAAQESGGDHYNHIESGPACGIMQIERSVHIDSTITAYNFEKGEYDSLEITDENIEDLETNIRIAAMLLRDCLRINGQNIPIAIQTYNYGCGNMNEVLDTYEDNNNLLREDTIRSQANNNWLKYRDIISVGDSEYLEHVLSYMPTNTITILDSNGNPLTIKIQNDTSKHYAY